MSIVIAVDGTAASGKGTLAKRLAQHFGFAHLDSGALYRLTALAVLEAKGDPKNETDALRGAQTIDFNLAGDPRIRTDIVGTAASRVAAIPAVRAALLDFQQSFLVHPPGGSPGAVMDGRDIGTVVFPTADCKFFVTASAAERARRRAHEIGAPEADLTGIQRDIEARDRRDSERAHAPLRAAPDAETVDTTGLTADEAAERLLKRVLERARP
jgi:cytidylate kinase